ncbi:hypothetical protein OJ998_00875 [Solirubrobacter taibaiensis]|nr:hypothetical protein [Solirubrobacter taibaiensis]
MDDQLAGGDAPEGGHAERVEHERGGLGARENASSTTAAAAAELALPRGMLGDVGHPQLVGGRAGDHSADEIERGDLPDACALGQSPCREPLRPSSRMIDSTALWPTMISRP